MHAFAQIAITGRPR